MFKNKKYREDVIIGILILFHIIGVVGLHVGDRSYFLSLTPINLCLSFVCLMVSFNNWSVKRVAVMLLLSVVTFSAEWIGVHTGYLFGNYSYGKLLGPTFDGVPLLIVANWIILCYGSCAVAKKLISSPTIAVILASLLMLLVDLLLEPVAMKYHWWHWGSGVIPISNYATWFLLSVPLNGFILKKDQLANERVARWLFCIVAVFFGVCFLLN